MLCYYYVVIFLCTIVFGCMRIKIYIYILFKLYFHNWKFSICFCVHTLNNQSEHCIHLYKAFWLNDIGVLRINSSSERFFSVRTSASLILRSTFHESKYFHTKIFPYIFHIKPLIFKTLSWSHPYPIFMKFSASNTEKKISFFFL